jgi:hypothetical protein
VAELRDEVVDVVRLGRRGPVRTTEAPAVGRQHVVAGVGKGRNLVAPRVGEIGEAVQEHDRGLCARLTGLEDGEVDADAHLDGARVVLPPHRSP